MVRSRSAVAAVAAAAVVRRFRRSLPPLPLPLPPLQHRTDFQFSCSGRRRLKQNTAPGSFREIVFCTFGHRMADYSQVASQIDISEEEKDKLVAEVIRCVLFKTHQSSGCPIKREELTQLITRNYRQRSLPAFIINEAQRKLADIFGYEMKEIQRIRPSSTKQRQASQQGAGEAKSYVIASKLPDEIYAKYVENKENAHLTGFTFAVVSLVHLAGGRISSDDLWHHLRRLGLDENDEKHPLFGSTRNAMESLVHQRYLQKDKGEGPEGNTLMYELAERSLDQSFVEKLKDYIGRANEP